MTTGVSSRDRVQGPDTTTTRARTTSTEQRDRERLAASAQAVTDARAARAADAVAGDVDRVEGAGAPALRGLEPGGPVRHGARGPAVRDLQEQLNARGYDVAVDGVFGMETMNGVRAFQRDTGIHVDGIVGPQTRGAFAATAETGMESPVQGPIPPVYMRQGFEGMEVEGLQRQLNALGGANLEIDGDFGPRTRRAVEDFQRRAGITVDGEVGRETHDALARVAAGTHELAPPGHSAEAPLGPGPARQTGPASRAVAVGENEFQVHNLTRYDLDSRLSVPGNRIIAMDSNSVRGREEILRPLIIIPNDATPAEREAAQASVDRMAEWMQSNLGGNRAATGTVRTTAENGRGLNGFFHTEFHSVNDSAAVRLIRENPEEYAQIMGETLGAIPGANFIVPHGRPTRYGEDPGAVSADGRTSEVNLARFVIENGFNRL